MCESPAECGFYYLKSRYYDPQICRFINADDFASTGQGFLGCNMFAYCLSNPVNWADPSGTYSYISIIGTKTEYVETDKYGQVYRTTIQYTNDCYDDYDNSFISSTAYSASIAFTINASGIVSIDNSDNPQWLLCDGAISTALAKEILDTTKSSLLGRTVNGVAREIRIHYFLDKIDIFEFVSNVDTTEIGGIVYGTDSYDSNATVFEHIRELPRFILRMITKKAVD